MSIVERLINKKTDNKNCCNQKENQGKEKDAGQESDQDQGFNETNCQTNSRKKEGSETGWHRKTYSPEKEENFRRKIGKKNWQKESGLANKRFKTARISNATRRNAS